MLLKIAIPTFNRNEFLVKCLNSLVVARNNYFNGGIQNDVTIYIYDNNVNLDLEKIVAEYRNILPNLNYIHNGINIGVERNVAQCYSVVDSCRFVHALGDDDAVHPSYFSVVMPVLKKYLEAPPAVVYLNAYGKDYDRHIPPMQITYNQFNHYKCNDFIEKFNVKLTFISSLIVCVDTMDYGKVDASATQVSQLYYALESMENHKYCVVINKYLIIAARFVVKANADADARTEMVTKNTPQTYNDLNEIYVHSFYAALRKYNINITRKLRISHFDKFILWEIYRRKLLYQESYDYHALGTYFGDLWTYKFVKSISGRRLGHSAALLIATWRRVVSDEFLKIVTYHMSHIYMYVRKL